MPKTFFGKLLADIAKPFTAFWHLFFQSAASLFKSLPQATQQALLHGSGVIDIINQMLSAAPADIIAAIKQTYPDLNATNLETGLFAVAYQFGLKYTSLDDCITALQAYLKSNTGGAWEKISSIAGQVLAFVLAPAGSKFMDIVSLIEYVYQTFIKKATPSVPEIPTVTTSASPATVNLTTITDNSGTPAT